MGIEFLDEELDEPDRGRPAPGTGTPGAADSRTDRRTRLLPSRSVVAGLVALAAAAVTVAIVRTTQNAAAPPIPRATAPAPTIAADLTTADPVRATLDFIYRRVSDPDRAADRAILLAPYDSCPPARRHGYSPVARALHQVRVALPGFRERDAGMVRDQFADLCQLELRGSAGRQRVLISITAPITHTRPIPHGTELPAAFFAGRAGRVDRARVSVVVYETQRHWRLVVGAVGTGTQADPQTLATIATDPLLRW